MTGRHRIAALCGGAALAALAGVPHASARVGVFFGFGPPAYYGAPYYYPPPPLYYPPPPVYYTPPPPPVYYTPPPPAQYAPPAYGTQSTPAATTCYAGPHVCPMESRVSVGTTCWCSNDAGGRAYGRAG